MHEDNKLLVNYIGYKTAVNEFYATPMWGTAAILEEVPLVGSILEPACGEGHMTAVLQKYYPQNEIVSTDLVEREDKFNCGNLISNVDFLTHNFDRKFNNIVTNPPFSMMQKFVKRSLRLATDKVLMFGNITFLEAQERLLFHKESPLKYVYCFSRRCNTYRDGLELDRNGKRWSGSAFYAWYVWEIGYEGEPVIRWLCPDDEFVSKSDSYRRESK